MKHYTILCCFILLTTFSNSQHYKSQHFSFNDPSQWSPNTNNNPFNPQEIISCTLAIPSLCLYATSTLPQSGFHIFYGNKMFDFLQDSNWSKIIVTNNWDNEQYNTVLSTILNPEHYANTSIAIDTEYIDSETQTETQTDMSMETTVTDTNTERRRLGSRDYRWRGCYKDTGRRALRYGPHRWHYSASRCQRACRNYRYFALQAGSWCSCDNSWKHATKYGRGRGCSRKHTGGGWRNDIYVNRRYRGRGRRRGRRRSSRRRRGRCGVKCTLRRQLNRLRKKYKRRRGGKARRERKRTYRKLYHFGKLIGKSMKSGDFGGLCGLTGECSMGDRQGRGRGCGARMRAGCPPRFATFLGPPHIQGRVSYILGTPPVGTAPQGMGQALPTGGLGVSPMYGGMMGGMGGMQAPGMFPGQFGGFNANPQVMQGNMGQKIAKKVVKEQANAEKRRLMAEEDIFDWNVFWDIRLEKCVFVSRNEEICALYYYKDGSVELVYNYNENVESVSKDKDELVYAKGNVWIWNESDNEESDINCNTDLLDYSGYILCIEYKGKSTEINAMILDAFDSEDDTVQRWDLINGEWDKIYDINGGDLRKICKYFMKDIQVCFEIVAFDPKVIEVTTQRVLSNDFDYNSIPNVKDAK